MDRRRRPGRFVLTGSANLLQLPNLGDRAPEELTRRSTRDVSRLRDASALFRLLELMALRTVELLDISSLGNEVDMRRGTVDCYLDVAKRLVKTLKLHFADSGLAATLAGLLPDDRIKQNERFGRLLESCGAADHHPGGLDRPGSAFLALPRHGSGGVEQDANLTRQPPRPCR